LLPRSSLLICTGDKAEAFANDFDARRWYPDWQGLLRMTKDGIHATLVFPHAEKHSSGVRRKHVLWKKPMGECR
jgi:hypothetical protein